MKNYRFWWLLLLVLALGASASAQWKESVLYAFQGGSDGYGPTDSGNLIVDREGNVYGTAAGGGSCKLRPAEE